MANIPRRSLSARFKRQLFQPYRDDDVRVLVEIDHDGFPTPYRFVSGDPNEFGTLVSGGETYVTFPFEFVLLGDQDGEPDAFLRIQNVDDRIGSTILGLSSDTLVLTIRIVMRETPDVIEYEAVNLELVDVVVDAVTVTGRVLLRGLATEPCPGRVLTNRISPAFFRG